MASRSPEPRLIDILDAITRLRQKTDGVCLIEFEGDWERRWLVERGLEIISEASRHLPEALKARHPHIPWKNIAGIGNVLRHDYDQASPEILWKIVMERLPALEQVCSAELRAIPYSESDGAEPREPD
jgi:uncharacterized protein with HEPN domain